MTISAHRALCKTGDFKLLYFVAGLCALPVRRAPADCGRSQGRRAVGLSVGLAAQHRGCTWADLTAILLAKGERYSLHTLCQHQTSTTVGPPCRAGCLGLHPDGEAESPQRACPLCLSPRAGLLPAHRDPPRMGALPALWRGGAVQPVHGRSHVLQVRGSLLCQGLIGSPACALSLGCILESGAVSRSWALSCAAGARGLARMCSDPCMGRHWFGQTQLHTLSRPHSHLGLRQGPRMHFKLWWRHVAVWPS